MIADFILTREQVRKVDLLAQSEYGIPGLILMENAGNGATRTIESLYGPGGKALVACGTGNNGGDGLVIARHLHNLGWNVVVLIVGNIESMSPDCAANDRIIRAMKLNRVVAANKDEAEAACGLIQSETVVVDALLGTGFSGTVRNPIAAFIEQINLTPKRATVSIDVPSGLDCDSGFPGGLAIRADHTITFVAMKPGFATDSGRKFTGNCHVVDIGVPKALIDQVRRMHES